MRPTALFALLVVLATIAGCSTAERFGAEGEIPATEALAELVHLRINAARDSLRLQPLTQSDALTQVAQRHSADMVARRYFSHVSPDGATSATRAEAVGVDCRVPLRGRQYRTGVLENLHQSSMYRSYSESVIDGRLEWTYDWFTPGEIARRVVSGWLGSAAHRRNLLDPSAEAHGIGVSADSESQLFVTQVSC